ncbi:hypothetical protein BV25DRAFT_1828870 [Artomyces pyxidatus]|uniref:Uncharacterized protein n=1 Tax=Artomyces pyxidatus TaxID=48021 RepID=A0ACB8SSW6_9AGAM|nr:hypothetical protein BV25DRAFT_1828870 [Artomyces pyxidatus]
MPSPEEEQISRLCPREDLTIKAQALLRTVRVKTGPGTGYDLGPAAAPGLPAICAYLTSKGEGYADPTKIDAQKASCLAPNVFTNALKTVEAALSASNASSPRKDTTSTVSYTRLVTGHAIGRVGRVVGWMDEVQAALLKSPEFRESFKLLSGDSAVVKTAVFFWVASRVLKLKQVKWEKLVKQHEVQSKHLSLVVELVEKTCTSIRERIEATVDELKRGNAAKATPKQGASTSRSQSPTKSALRSTPAQNGTPSVKRKVAFSDHTSSDAADEDEDDIYVPESPSKRQKTSTPYKTPRTPAREEVYTYDMPVPPPELVASSSKVRLDHSVSDTVSDVEMADVSLPSASTPHPIPGPSTPHRSPAKSAYRTPDTRRRASSQAEDVEDEDEEALPVVRRFRPVLLDRMQWAQRAPRLERQRAVAEKSKRALVERWGHPFEWLRSEVAATG